MRFCCSFSVLSMGYFRRSGEAGGSLRYPAYTQPDGWDPLTELHAELLGCM